MGFLILGVLLGRVMRFFAPNNKNKSGRRQTNKQQQDAYNTSQKKFSKNEGEYIDYEEIKDNE
ncbi:DUF4834 family protein [Dysgonomonas hofstadii]|uniref:DUF4834 family protein n=1 Tax=Dysgonomonas hofstadii TaxID=637886 RepID=UPI001FE37841|nr:DUF4834 family protein [Dysgonomonas hofstadii]